MANKLQVANIATKEVVDISNGVIRNGVAYYLSKSEPKAKWCEKYHVKVVGSEEAGAYTKYIIEAQDDWNFVVPVKDGEKKERKPRTPKPAPAPAPEPKEESPAPVEEREELPAPPQEVEVEIPEETPEPKKEGVHSQQPATDEPSDDDISQIAAMLLKLKKGSAPVNKEMVVSIVKEILAEELPKVKPQEVQHTIKVADLPEYKCPKGTNPELLKLILTMVINDRVIGRFPWLYGPAGSGKSTLAKMVADALGIPFYSVSSLQQKYELEGYTDAVGEFVQTAFYKAMAEGGIFCFDEISTTSGEVQVAFNTAAAQLVYNFPKMGMVKAHENFHIIACDNSTGRGGDKRYISRFQLDASTLDRYNFIEVDYSDEHDLNMAAGDKDLVTFMKAVRKALDEANTTYLATPRASKAIKALQATGMSDKDALWYGLCSGWKKQDIRTIQARMYGSNKWFNAFEQIADTL